MRERTKHSIKTLLTGIGVLLGTWLLIPSPLCLIPGLCPTLVIYGKSFNIGGYMSLLFLTSWVLGTLGSLIAIGVGVKSLLKPEKYEVRFCPTCGAETDQFLSGTNYEKGYKVYDALKRGESKADREAHLVSHEYSCEKCRKKNVAPITRPAFSGICAKCGGKMRYNKSSWKWVCDNCQTSVTALAPTGET